MDGVFSKQVKNSLDSALLVILEQSQDCIKIISPDGRLSFVNSNGLTALQLDSLDTVSGQPWAELWPEESRHLVIDAVERAKRGERTRFEAQCPTAKGEMRWWDVAVSPTHDADGRLAHIISTSRDITEQRVRLAAAEREAEMQEIVAQETRHRLQNLITVISSMAKLIARRSDSLEEFERSFLQQLIHLDRAQALLTDSAGNAGAVGRVVTTTLEGEGFDPRLTIAPLPQVRIGDQTVQLLSLALGELRTNAIKHGALSVETGRVTLKVTQTGNDLIFVWTEDTGEDRPAPQLSGGSGLDLIRRMISTTGQAPDIEWTGRGLKVTFRTPRD